MTFKPPAAKLVSSAPTAAQVVIVGMSSVSGSPALVGLPDSLGSDYTKQYGRGPAQLALDLGGKSDRGSVTVLPSASQRVVVVGLGDAEPTPEQLRRAVGGGVRALAGLGADKPLDVAIALGVTEPEEIKAVVEGALLGAYTYVTVGAKDPKPLLNSVHVVSTSANDTAQRAVAAAEVVSRAVWATRDWINTPANLLFPESFAALASAHAKEAKLDVTVWGDKELERDGMGGIMAVGGGSTRKPRLVRVDYSPKGADFHLAIVGKGITFDSGGLNLKPGDSMYTMKCDMSGAAAVIASVRAIADLGLKIRVTAYAPMAENLPSGSAYRPSDVLTMYKGKTVENYNSDAEGRLVLADAITRAGEDSPDMIVDVATLTGACMVALGERITGVMASDEQTSDRVLAAAEAAGEEMWPLPIPEEMKESLKSKVADIRSGGSSRYGGALVAAAFLREFVAPDTAWAHLDIAGPAFNDHEPYDYVPAGGTGTAVRTLISLAESLQS